LLDKELTHRTSLREGGRPYEPLQQVLREAEWREARPANLAPSTVTPRTDNSLVSDVESDMSSIYSAPADANPYSELVDTESSDTESSDTDFIGTDFSDTESSDTDFIGTDSSDTDSSAAGMAEKHDQQATQKQKVADSEEVSLTQDFETMKSETTKSETETTQ